MYVMDYGNNRVQKWYPGSNFGLTVAAASMYYPYSMTMDGYGNIYVSDTYYHRVIKFSLLCRMLNFYFLFFFVNYFILKKLHQQQRQLHHQVS